MARNFTSLTVVERGTVPRRLQGKLNSAIRTGLYAVAEDHHRVNVPKRFTAEHARKAYYFRRSREYESRKIREGRGNDPMVYSGRSRARAKVTRLSGTAKRVTATYSLPALNFTVGAKSRQRTMRSEFEKVIWTERRRGERLAVRTTNQAIKNDSTLSRRRLISR